MKCNFEIKFEKWCKNLLSDDINIADKLDNMCGSEMSEELVELINNNKDVYYPRIEKYIKANVINIKYRNFIVSEAVSLKVNGFIDDAYDYSSGLYNCDEIYVRAIADALGFMWLVN